MTPNRFLTMSDTIVQRKIYMIKSYSKKNLNLLKIKATNQIKKAKSTIKHFIKI